jgi:DNA modification methylase
MAGDAHAQLAAVIVDQKSRRVFEMLTVKRVPLAQLVPDPQNARTHDDKNLGAIRSSLTKFGQVEPLVVRKGSNVVIGGNGRLEAMRSLEWTHAAVTWFEGTDAEARALGLALNRTAELAAWDEGRLAAALAEVKAEGLADAAGWTDDEIAAAVASVTPAEPAADPGAEVDRADELLAKWKVQPGDLWAIPSKASAGKEHRLLCGDSTNAEDVRRVMGGEKATICFTDPPYGVSIGAKNRMLNTFQPAGRCLTDIVDDDLPPEELAKQLEQSFRLVRTDASAEDCTVFVTAPQSGELSMMMMMMMRAAGLPVRHVLIWKKNQPTFSMGRLDYDYQHEPILMTWGKRHKRPMLGTHKTSVWEIDKPRASGEHPTMKPVELYVNAFLNNCDAGDIAYEPFSGSGTSIVAAEQTGRLCRAIEISPKYVAVALERLSKMGLEPTRGR